MNMSMANRLGLSPAEAKDNRNFETADEVGHYFNKLLRGAGQSLDKSTGANSETLKSFLESIRIYNRASLRQFLKESGLSTSPNSAYAEFKRQYEPLLVNQVLYLIDEEFLVKNDRIAVNPYTSPPPDKKIEIIMSTLLWANQLYSSCAGIEWEMGFVSFPCVSLSEFLNWLGKVDQRKFLTGHQLSDQDEKILTKIWHWFETHDQRPIRLAFAMASHGMVRDVRQERGKLWGIIADLDELNEFPLPIGNKANTVA